MKQPASPTKPQAVPSAELVRATTCVLVLGAVASLALLGVTIRRFDASTTRWPIVFSVFLAATSAGLIWSSVRLKPVARVVLATIGVFAMVLLYGTEAALGLVPQVRRTQGLKRLAERTGTPHDERSTPEVVRALRDSGVRAVPAVMPNVILGQWGPAADRKTAWTSPLLPLAGVSRRPTVFCNEDGQFRLYDSDERGFANPVSSWSQPIHDIVLLGDSFTHGACVDVDSTYAARIRRRWPSSLNLGTRGSGPLLELATLTEYAAPFRPKVVVWQFFINDMSDLATERHNPLLLRYLAPGFSQGLPTRQSEIDAAIESWIDRVYAAERRVDIDGVVSWRQILTLYRLRALIGALFLDNAAELALFREILTTARDRVRTWGGQLYFVYVSEWERYHQPTAMGSQDVRDAVLAITRELGLPLIDLESAVRQHPDRAKLFARHELVPAHFSAMGYELMATEVGNVIEKDLPSSPPPAK